MRRKRKHIVFLVRTQMGAWSSSEGLQEPELRGELLWYRSIHLTSGTDVLPIILLNGQQFRFSLSGSRFICKSYEIGFYSCVFKKSICCLH